MAETIQPRFQQKTPAQALAEQILRYHTTWLCNRSEAICYEHWPEIRELDQIFHQEVIDLCTKHFDHLQKQLEYFRQLATDIINTNIRPGVIIPIPNEETKINQS